MNISSIWCRQLSLFIRLLLCAFVVVAAPEIAGAQGFSITVTADENGHGRLTNTAGFSAPSPAALQSDPGPGGLSSALTYSLLNPPGLTAGDVVLLETVNGLISDIIRFNPDERCTDGSVGCLVFYSDADDGADSIADTGFPTALYANDIALLEIGPEGMNGATYTPTTGQPGFVTGAAGPVTYVLQSDVPVPEPTSLTLFGFALAGFGLARRKWSRNPS